MPDVYAKRTNRVKPDCTSDVLYVDNGYVHVMYMAVTKAKKVIPRPKGSRFQPTFIKQWRDKRDFTQEQLAERVTEYLLERGVTKGYTYASIGRLENGKIGYTQLILEAVADALSTDPASLLMRDPSDGTAMWTVWEQALPGERKMIEEQAGIVVKNRRKSG